MNFIDDLYTKALTVYNVNPIIFIGLFYGSLILYYPGYFIMLRAGYTQYKTHKEKNTKFNLDKLLKDERFIKGLVLNRFGWVLPYLYLMLFGKNLPIWVYILIIFWVSITTYFAIVKVHSKIINKSIKYMKVSGEDEIKAREFLSKRYSEVNFIPKSQANKPYQDEYVKYSKYFIAKRAGSVVGVIRIVKNSKVGLPVLNDSNIYSYEKDIFKKIGENNIVEIGNLAAIPGRNISKGLYRLVIKYCLDNKLHAIARIDSDLLDKLIKRYWILKFFVKRIGDDVPYPGSVCVPIKIKLFRFYFIFV